MISIPMHTLMDDVTGNKSDHTTTMNNGNMSIHHTCCLSSLKKKSSQAVSEIGLEVLENKLYIHGYTVLT